MSRILDLTEEQIRDGVYNGYLNKFKSRLYGLLCEREKNGEWEKFIDTLLIELNGFKEEERGINYYSLYHKIAALRYLEYDYFRKTIFECMNILSGMEKKNGVL